MKNSALLLILPFISVLRADDDNCAVDGNCIEYGTEPQSMLQRAMHVGVDGDPLGARRKQKESASEAENLLEVGVDSGDAVDTAVVVDAADVSDSSDAEDMEAWEEDETEAVLQDESTARVAALEAQLIAENEAENTARFKEFLAYHVEQAIGAHGVAVQDNFEAKEVCPESMYLDETFVHLDQKQGTFICQPCSILCDGGCSGPDSHHCYKKLEKRQAGQRPTTGTARRNMQLAQSCADAMLGDLNTTEDILAAAAKNPPLDPQMQECEKAGTCSVKVVSYASEMYGKVESVTVDTVQHASDSYTPSGTEPDMTDNFHTKIMNMINHGAFKPDLDQSNVDAGYFGYVVPANLTKPANFTQGTQLTASDLAALAAGANLTLEENPNQQQVISNSGQAIAANWGTMTDVERAEWVWRNKKQLKALMKNPGDTATWKRLAGGICNPSKTESVQNHYLSVKLGSIVPHAQCMYAVDKTVQAIQRARCCIKSNTDSLKKKLCTAPAAFDDLYWLLKGVANGAANMKKYGAMWKIFPIVGGFAGLMEKVGKSLDTSLKPQVDKLGKLKKTYTDMGATSADKLKMKALSPAFDEANVSMECCVPRIGGKSGTEKKFGWCQDTSIKGVNIQDYRCGACGQGALCSMTRACNAFTHLETKYNLFMEKWLDPIVDNYLKVVSAVKRGVPGDAKMCSLDLTANPQSDCEKLKKAADKIYDTLDTPWVKFGCPLTIPSVSFPDLGVITAVLKPFNAIADAIQWLINKLTEQRCVSYPWATCTTVRKCTGVPYPCCGRRRRWTGCKWCKKEVCVTLPSCKFIMKQACFSIEKIIAGISGAVAKFLSPILKIIEKAIGVVLDPIMKIITGIVNAVLGKLSSLANFNFPLNFGGIDFGLDFPFDMPKLDQWGSIDIPGTPNFCTWFDSQLAR